MAHPILRVLSAFAEFVSRFFPISKDESTVLEELGGPIDPIRTQTARTEPPAADRAGDASGERQAPRSHRLGMVGMRPSTSRSSRPDTLPAEIGATQTGRVHPTPSPSSESATTPAVEALGIEGPLLLVAAD